MSIFQFPIISTYILGALHALEPGHGKSIVALHTVQSRKISEAFSLLASLLLSHFLLVVGISTLIYFNSSLFDIEWVKFLAPAIIIFYGLFLLIKTRKNSDEYIACSCSHTEDSKSVARSPIIVGMMAGLTPCPSVFSPIVIAMTLNQVDQIFFYILSYIAGVVSLFVLLTVAVVLLKKASSQHIESLFSKFNPHLISGSLMVMIGIIYIAFGVLHSH
jgi:nickel/cobalt transporter (NicO) family protein